MPQGLIAYRANASVALDTSERLGRVCGIIDLPPGSPSGYVTVAPTQPGALWACAIPLFSVAAVERGGAATIMEIDQANKRFWLTGSGAYHWQVMWGIY